MTGIPLALACLGVGLYAGFTLRHAGRSILSLIGLGIATGTMLCNAVVSISLWWVVPGLVLFVVAGVAERIPQSGQRRRKNPPVKSI